VLTKEQLEQFTKEQLIVLLLEALRVQELATTNMQSLAGLLQEADGAMNELRSRNQTLEAENIELRNRP
jgi:hypothetical protein